MSRISGKINLAQLKGQVKSMKGLNGMVDCFVIPIALNNLYKGEKGIYLDLIAFEIENKKSDSKDTHLVKQSLSKEVREKMTKEEINEMPILGNLQVWSGQHTEADPQTNVSDVASEESDLPF
jgi:hypothetical protein